MYRQFVTILLVVISLIIVAQTEKISGSSVCQSQFLLNSEISQNEHLIVELFMKDLSSDNHIERNLQILYCSLESPCGNLMEILSVLNKTLVEDNFDFYNKSTDRLLIVNIKLLSDIMDGTENYIETPIVSGLKYIFQFETFLESNRNIITLKWKGHYDRSYLLTRPDIDWFYFENVEVNLFRLNNTDNANLGFCNCSIVDTWMKFNTNRNVYFEKSQLTRSIIYAISNLWQYDDSETIGYGEYYVTGNTAVYNNSIIHDTRLRWTLSSVENLIIDNSLFEYFLLELTCKQVTNVLIRNSFFLHDDSNSREESVNAIQGNSFQVINCTFRHAYSFIFVRAYTFIGIDRVLVSNNELVKENFITMFYGVITVQSSITVNITNSQFYNNIGHDRASSLYLSDVNVFHVENCQFTNNTASSIYSESYPNRMFDDDTTYYWYTISGCTFEGNTCAKEGCGIYISDSIDLTIENNTFKNNIAQYSGAALFIKIGTRARILNNLFVENKVLYNILAKQPQNTLYYGGGGALSIVTEQLDISESFLQSNTFIRNEALIGGSLFFVREALVRISNCTFIENVAKRGGAMFYYSPIIDQTMIIDNEFQGNSAEIGNDLLTSVVSLQWDNRTVQHVRPGEKVELLVETFQLNGLLVPTNTENFTLTTNNPNVYLEFSQNETSFTITMYLKGDITEESYGHFSVILHRKPVFDQRLKLFNYIMNSCGDGNELRVIDRNQVAVSECVESPVSPLPLILSVSIPVGVIIAIISTFIGLCIGIIGIPKIYNVKRRLTRLKQKEIAEQNVEQKIIDKKVVFSINLEDDDERKPLLKSEKLRFIISPQDIDIVKKIAEGGNGIVYKGKWKDIDVAIKTIKSFSESQDDFQNEISILASLRNPYILIFYGVCITENETFMITEFLENGSLEKVLYLCRIGQVKLSFNEKLRILYQVACGMDYLHSLNPKIIHRDLKPGNILLDKDMNCKVSDFGLSRTVNNQTNHSITRNIGSLLYIAPEMILETDQTKDSIDPLSASKIDSYSFGIIMWELFFELAPFTENSKTIHLYENSNNFSAINILHMVTQGKRPSIPFETIEQVRDWLLLHAEDEKIEYFTIILEYFELAKQCWSENPNDRPDFSKIVKKLYNFMKSTNTI